jgi:hypothetical protein
MQVNEAWTTAAEISGIRSTITGWYYVAPSAPSGDNSCDMASTTEAIYAVGYSMQTYLGIFLLLIAGIASYAFTKKYV